MGDDFKPRTFAKLAGFNAECPGSSVVVSGDFPETFRKVVESSNGGARWRVKIRAGKPLNGSTSFATLWEELLEGRGDYGEVEA